MIAPTQLLNVGRGSHEIAIDLSADQAETLKQQQERQRLAPAVDLDLLRLMANDNPKVSTVTSNPNYQKAVRYGLDYSALVILAGKGAIQAPGVIPSMFLGSLPQSARIKTDLAKAKAALAASGVGSQQVTLQYPSDLTINGVPFTSMAQKIQSSLQAVGFNITLSGSPTSNWLNVYRSGKMALGLSLWGPDYPDPADYLAFTPGNLVGLRAGWPKGSDAALEKLAAKAMVTTAPGGTDGDLPADPADAQRQQPVLPADPADAGVRVDQGSEGRGLQRRVRRRRHAGLARVELDRISRSRRGRPGRS